MPVARLTLQSSARMRRTGTCDPLQRRCGTGDSFGAADGYVAVGFVPAHGALQSGGHWAGAKTEFALRARTIHKHIVTGDFYAFEGDARLAERQARKNSVGVGGRQREAVRNLQRGCRE